MVAGPHTHCIMLNTKKLAAAGSVIYSNLILSIREEWREKWDTVVAYPQYLHHRYYVTSSLFRLKAATESNARVQLTI